MWSNNNIKFLKKYLGIQSYSWIAKKLNRSNSAVIQKASSLNLTSKVYQKIKFKIKPTEKAYIAGLIDGEGFIGFLITKSKKTGFLWVTPTLQVSMTDKQTIHFIKQTFKIGRMLEKKRIYELPDSRKPWFNTIYQFAVSDRPLLKAILKTILPYLKTKKIIAKLVLKFIEIHKYGKISLKERKIIYQVRKLNQANPYLLEKSRKLLFD